MLGSVILKYILARGREASSWAAVVGFIAAQLSISVSPEINTWFIQGGVWATAGLGILIKDKLS